MKPSLYTRPDKPKHIPVARREDRPVTPALSDLPELVEVSGLTECHVTPPDTADEMVSWLDVYHRYPVLEPHAGTGNLIKAILDTDEPPIIEAVELSYDLIQFLYKRFPDDDVRFTHSCFLDFAKEINKKYHRIIMNPPFKKVKQHMSAALSLLADEDAVLVALVPITYQHEDAQLIDELDNNTFSSAKVHTKIIKFER